MDLEATSFRLMERRRKDLIETNKLNRHTDFCTSVSLMADCDDRGGTLYRVTVINETLRINNITASRKTGWISWNMKPKHETVTKGETHRLN